jgi:esterase/lipase superfamily enzyme
MVLFSPTGRHARALGALISLLAFCVGAQAQSTPPFNPLTFEATLASAEGDAERLSLVEEAIIALEAAPDTDFRTYFDLNELRLELLMNNGATGAAADLAAGLAQFAQANRETVNRDPIHYTRLSAELFEEAGNLRQALRMFEAEADLRLDAGQTGEALARVYRDMGRVAEARGDMAAVEQYKALAQTALEPIEEGTRALDDTGFAEVEVFYATDRARTGSDEPNEFYGYGRGSLEYGVVTVSIPATHEAGAIELPSIWRLEFGPKPTKHVMVRKIEPMAAEGYFGKMRAEVAQKSRKEAFVFVHGFNVRFDAAARRAAQLTYDMNYSGVPILYSWPSAGKQFNYVADTAVVRLSGRRLSHFLEELHANSGAETIHIIAHSMGNRALTDALELLALRTDAEQSETPMFGQLFFAAPDVDADLFREMMKTIKPLAQRMTLYSSENDWALRASRNLHGGLPRAGQAGEDILAETNFDTVDMSNLGEDMLAHSYFANDSSALVDIASLIWRNSSPGNRCGLSAIETDQGNQAWEYKKGACADRLLVGLISHFWNWDEVTADDVQGVVASLVSDEVEAKRLETALLSLLNQ